MLPYFIGVGAQKSGTSWIFACLEEHPEIYMPIKEIHFFSKDILFKKGLTWYKNHFEPVKKNQKAGEFSTTYLHSIDALNRILNNCPSVKIIVSLRNPKSRAVSHFKNDIMAGIISKDSKFSEMLFKKNDYWERGLYYEKIKWLFKNFGKEKVKVLFIEEATNNQQKFISSIYKFLDVNDKFISSSFKKKINVSSMPRFVFWSFIMDYISKILRKLGMVYIVRYFRNVGIIDLARKANSSKHKTFDDNIIWPKELIKRFAKDKQNLERLLSKKIECW